MGAWSNTTFGNDWALDWVGDMEEAGTVSMIEKALIVGKTPVAPIKPWFIERMWGRKPHDIGLQASACCRALAAAEYVAAWMGQPGADLPEKSAEWIKVHASGFSVELVPLAVEAVSTIARHSELKLLSEEGDPTGGQEWHDVLDDLKRRLESK